MDRRKIDRTIEQTFKEVILKMKTYSGPNIDAEIRRLFELMRMQIVREVQ